MSGRGWTPLIFLFALALYLATMAPGIDYGDPATYVTRCANPPPPEKIIGVAEHPLYTYGGWLVLRLPFFSRAFLLNLYSVIPGAAAVAFLFAAVRQWTGALAPALAAAIAFAFSHTQWIKAVKIDVYALQNACTAFALWAAVRWVKASESPPRPAAGWLLLFGFALGLGPSHHLLSTFLFPSALLLWLLDWWRGRLRLRHVGGAILAGVAGGLPFLLPVAYTLATQGLGHFLDRATGTAETRGKIFAYTGAEQLGAIARCTLLSLYQFPSPALVLGLAGLIRFVRRGGRLRLFLLGGLLLNTVFAIGYRESHQYELLATSYLLFSFLAGAGAAAAGRILATAGRRAATLAACALAPIAVYALTPIILRATETQLPIRALPYRDAAWHFLFPPKTGWRGAERFAEEGLAKLPPDAVVMADWSTWGPLLYVQEDRGLRRDVTVRLLESGDDCRAFLAAVDAGKPAFFAVPDLQDAWPESGLRCDREGFMLPAVRAVRTRDARVPRRP